MKNRNLRILLNLEPLTLEQKERIIDLIIEQLQKEETKFICIGVRSVMTSFICENFNDQDTDVAVSHFPELKKMIKIVGKKLDPNYKYDTAWVDVYTGGVSRQFRIDKLNEFKRKINEQ